MGAVINISSRDIEASHILQEETKSAKSDDEKPEETPPETKEDKEESKDSEESEEEPEPSQSEAPGAEVSQSEAPDAKVSQSASPEDETNQSEKDKEAIPSETKESVSLVVDFLTHLPRVCLCGISFQFLFTINFNWWMICKVFPCFSFNSTITSVPWFD